MASPVPPVAYVQKGESIDYTPAAAVTAGDVAVIGGFVGVATHDIAASALGSLTVEGVFDFPKAVTVGTGVAKGTFFYWDAVALQATVTDTGNDPIGYSVATCADADTTVRIALDKYPLNQQKVVNLLAASGAISPNKAGTYMITKAGIAALTLAAPTAVTDDGKVIEISSDTANAHTITCPANVFKAGGAAVTIFTFTGTTSGGGLRLMAYNGTWKVLASIGGAFS